jgi:PAS domain S-box-containing protein
MESLQNTILIIEDDLGLNELICEKMTECGYKTHSALSALQANSWLSTNSPILMVVDYSLNDMTAKDFIVDMQEKGLVLPPFIIATGQGDERIAVEMMKLGARDYIIKDTNLLDLLPTVIGRVVKEVENELKLKRAQEELKESEIRFRKLLQDIQTVSVQGYAPDGTTQYWNKASERLYGYTAEEAIGKNLLDLIIPDEMRFGVKQATEQMAESGQPIPPSELMLKRKDGSLVSVFSNHTIVEVAGQPQELFCIDIDLSEIKQAQDALRESEKMFSDMAINSAGVIYQFYARNDGSTGFYYLSPKVKEMFNFSDDLSSIEWRLGEYVHPDDKDFFLTNVANSISEVKELDVEARVLTSMGTKWIHFLSRPMKKNDEIVFNGIMIDVTERKELTISIQENEAKMKKVLVESSILIDVSSEVADYQKITNTIAEISGAKYVSFDIVNNVENVIQTYAISGVKENLLKISSMLGFDVVNKKWKNDPIRAERIKKQIVTRFNSINDITGAQIPLAISKVIEKTFNLGEVVIVKIAKENETIAFFTLFFSKEKALQNTDLLELFANEVSLFMERKKAEEALIKKMNEMEYFQSITIGRELKMIELKKEINQLLNALGKENKYIIVD